MITLDDAGLSNFATGLLSASGVIFAVSATIWIFVFDRRSQDQGNALRQVKSNGSVLYEFLVSDSSSPENYIAPLTSYHNFARTIAHLCEPYSATNVPDYINWRKDTSEIILKSNEFGQKFHAASQQVQSGKNPSGLDLNTFNFHSAFVDLMHPLDLSIQELDWALGVRASGKKQVELALGTTVVVFLATMLVALASNVKTANGVGDDWNFFFGVLLTAGIFMVCFFLVRAFMVNGISREEWITKREKQAWKKFGLNNLANG